MISAVLDHLWQSTLVALAAGLLATAFRKAGARVRYGLWLAASAKFLIPFAALAWLGRLLTPAVRPPPVATADTAFITRASQPFSHALGPPLAGEAAVPVAHAMVAAGPQAAMPLNPGLILLGVWALGAAAVLIFWMARWARVRSAVRHAAPVALAAPAPMPVLVSAWMQEPGLVGLWRPVLVVPETLLDHLTRPEIDALVAHEACHLRRRDNLTAMLHMLVEALFWFHPVVWWIGARLIEERERACDEAVIGSGHSRAAYARSLVECCRLYLQSPLSCVAGASGSHLQRRVEAIMTAPPCPSLSRSAKALLLSAGVCALASPVAAGWLTSPAGHAAAAQVAALASKAAPVQLADLRMPSLAAPRAQAAAQDEVAAPRPGEPTPPPQVAPIQASDPLPLSPEVQLAQASLIPVSARTPEADVLVTAAAVATTPTPSLLSDPPWVRTPPLNWSSPDSVYPTAAGARHLPGRATLRCHVDDRGQLFGCKVISETPVGMGFGTAAIRFQPDYRLRTLAADGLPVRGRMVDVTVEFTPRDWARIVGEGKDWDASKPAPVVRWIVNPLEPSLLHRAHYPPEALAKGLAAEVALHCKVKPDGYLTDCLVARETPAGLGFGRYALLARPNLLRVDTHALDGSPMAGRTVEVRYVFNPPCYAMADRNQTPCPAPPR